MCTSCVVNNAKYVGMTGLYGLHGLGDTAASVDTSHRDTTRDLISAGIALAGTTLYHYKAPKKWKRPKTRLGAVVAVVGAYFAMSLIYGAVTS
jgi:hypothetical protein